MLASVTYYEGGKTQLRRTMLPAGVTTGRAVLPQAPAVLATGRRRKAKCLLKGGHSVHPSWWQATPHGMKYETFLWLKEML